MKWKLRNALIVAVIAAGASAAYAKHSIVLAGLDTAKQYHGHSNRKVYIRVGSFSHETNAENVRNELKARLHYPVRMARNHGYYTVTVGPLASAEAVRQVGDTIPADLQMQNQKTKSKAVKASTKKTTAPVVETKTHHNVQAATPAPQPEPIAEAPSTTRVVYNKFINVFKSNSTQGEWTSSFFLSGGVGDSFNRAEGTNTLATGAGWPDDEYVTNTISDQPYFSVGGGYAWARPTDVIPYYSLGMKLNYISTSTISGYIDQYSLPEFRNYNFQYDVQLFNIMAMAKVDLYRWKNLMPYVTGGLGLTNYSTSQYLEIPTSNVTPRVSPGFGSASGSNFSYSFGAGIDYAFMQNLWLNVEFNYTDFGTVGTGDGQDYATLTDTNYDNEALRHTLSATSVFLGLTYFVG